MPGKKLIRDSEGLDRWNLDDIQQLIDLLIDREISEFEMEKDGMRVRILRRNTASAAPAHSAPNPAHPPAAVSVAEAAPAPTVSQEKAPADPAPEASAEGIHILKSPIVGTYYAAPAPDAPPFVNPGDFVHVGQVLCIVEAMKLMNEIEAEVAGEIVRIYVEGGQPVEYGQPLFAIKSS